MNDVSSKLLGWFADRFEEFGDDAISPDQAPRAIELVMARFNTQPVKYLGAGDNGIAFLCADGTIVKFTIDEQEAILWNRLKGSALAGITHLKDVVNLSSSTAGDSLIFVLNAELAPNPVAPGQAREIQQIKEKVHLDMQQRLKELRSRGNVPQETYYNIRALSFVRAYQELADRDPSFQKIPDLLMDLADKHKAFIFDLQPDNFRTRLNGEVILVDPSVPDLLGDRVRPDSVMYEERLAFRLEISRIFYE